MIIRNSAKCLLCDVEIESRHRHDFVGCTCKNIYVDGGKEYLRRVGDIYKEGITWIDTSRVTEEKEEDDL